MRQNPEDLDPDQYVEDRELTELPEIPLVYMEPVAETVNPEIPLEVNPEPVMQVPEAMEDIDGIHERIQSELLNQEKEDVSRAEEILEFIQHGTKYKI